MGRLVRVPFFGAALALLFLSGHANAVSSEPKEQPAGPARVEMAPFMAPVEKTAGEVTAAPVTPVLVVADAAQAEHVCWLSPRIMDTFVQILHREPLPMSENAGRKLLQMKKEMAEAVNAALGSHMISQLDFVPWTRAKDKKAISKEVAAAVRCGI